MFYQICLHNCLLMMIPLYLFKAGEDSYGVEGGGGVTQPLLTIFRKESSKSPMSSINPGTAPVLKHKIRYNI